MAREDIGVQTPGTQCMSLFGFVQIATSAHTTGAGANSLAREPIRADP
jgi:hypothetical protein